MLIHHTNFIQAWEWFEVDWIYADTVKTCTGESEKGGICGVRLQHGRVGRQVHATYKRKLRFTATRPHETTKGNSDGREGQIWGCEWDVWGSKDICNLSNHTKNKTESSLTEDMRKENILYYKEWVDWNWRWRLSLSRLKLKMEIKFE